MSVDADPQQVLKAIGGIDASRRVGWAKAYSAEEKADDLARDLNMARADKEIYRKHLSWLLGFLTTWIQMDPEGDYLQPILAPHLFEMRQAAAQGPHRAGMDAAQQASEQSPRRVKWQQNQRQRLERKTDMRKVSADSYRKGYLNGAEQLAKECGYENARHMRESLSQRQR